MPIYLSGDVAHDSGSSSDLDRVGKTHGLAEVPFGAAVVGDAHGV